MILTTRIYRHLENLDPKIRETFLVVLEEIEKEQQNRVTKDDFIELKEVVRTLVQSVNTLKLKKQRKKDSRNLL